jgi:hypothetical protein
VRRRRRCGAGGRATARRASGSPPSQATLAPFGRPLVAPGGVLGRARATSTDKPCVPALQGAVERWNETGSVTTAGAATRGGGPAPASCGPRTQRALPIAAPKGLHARAFRFSPEFWLSRKAVAGGPEKSPTAFLSLVRSWQERSPGLSLFLPCATIQGAGKGVKDDEPRATARQATSTTTRRTPTCGRRAPAAASDRGGGSLERPPHWPSWPGRPCARSSLRLSHARARLTDAPCPIVYVRLSARLRLALD